MDLIVARLRYLSSPQAEVMSDKERLDQFVYWGGKAADEIAELRHFLEKLMDRFDDMSNEITKLLYQIDETDTWRK